MDRGEPRTGCNFEVGIPLVVIASPVVSFYIFGQAIGYNGIDPTSPVSPHNRDNYLRW